MPNTLGMEERTLAEIADPEDSINKVGSEFPRKYGLQPLLVRVTDHAYNTVEEENDPDKMAVFSSTEAGGMWLLGGSDSALNSVNVRENTSTSATGILPKGKIYGRLNNNSGAIRCNVIITELSKFECL